MLWSIKGAAVEAQMALENRGPRPGNETRIMQSRPPLDEATALCIRCWNHLSSCRLPSAIGHGSIPWTAIDAWARREQLDDEMAGLLVEVIMRQDHNQAASAASRAAFARKNQPR